MILVDTSAWIDFFRGAGPLAEAVDDLLAAGDAALCGPVITELRRGLHSAKDRLRVLPLLDGCHLLDQPPRLWDEAGELGWALGRKGVSVKSLDLLIACYALSHSTPLLTRDKDFELMRRAGVGLALERPETR